MLLLLLVAASGVLVQARAATSAPADGSQDGPVSAVPWCGQAEAHWAATAMEVPSRTVLGHPDVHTCAVLTPPPPDQLGAVTRLRLAVQAQQQEQEQEQQQAAAGARLYRVVLLECDAGFWQLQGVAESEHVCIANAAALQAACTQWPLPAPELGGGSSHSCAPPGTAFALPGSLRGRVLVLQAHWRLPGALNSTAVPLPGLHLHLGAAAGEQPQQQPQAAAGAGAGASLPAGPSLLGTFVGSGVYPPSSLSKGLQAFNISAPAAAAAAAAAGPPTVSAELACGKRCTYRPLGRLSPRPVTVVGYSFATFDRALTVSFKVQRGRAARARGGGAVAASSAAAAAGGGGVLQLQEPFQLFPGDVVSWRCEYDAGRLRPGGALTGGHAAHPAAQREQCTLRLHYWPRVEELRGCSAALLDDALLGENMCAGEAADLLSLAGREEQQFPLRRMYDEHSFPAAPWMGGWKATHLVLQMALVWAVLWGSQALLAGCSALGPVRARFLALAPGQQRNVAVYVAHLLLDTLALGYCCRPMLELWGGWAETTGEVRTGEWCFTYIVACYALELTWRRRVDTMLAIHHVGTITIILLYAGELTAHTYRVANSIIVLAAFALMEQPTYVALLCKRMLPPSSRHVVVAARVGYVSWFLLKGASLLLAGTMFAEDWHLMPRWVRVNFIITWLVATLVQGWSGVIQYGIYRQIRRAHIRATASEPWEQKQQLLKRQAAAALGRRPPRATSASDSSDEAQEEEQDPASDGSSSPGGMCRPLLGLGGLGPLPSSGSTEVGDSDALDCIAAARPGGRGGAGEEGAGPGRLPSRQCSCDSDCSSCSCDSGLGRDGARSAGSGGASAAAPAGGGGCRLVFGKLGSFPLLATQDSLVSLPSAGLDVEQLQDQQAGPAGPQPTPAAAAAQAGAGAAAATAGAAALSHLRDVRRA